MQIMRVPLVFGVLAVIFTYPLVFHLDQVSDPVDPLLNTWIIAWVQHALVHDPLSLFDANIFYPREDALLYSEALLLPSVLLLPIRLAGATTILVYNLFLLLGYTLSGCGGYWLGRWISGSRAGGWALGIGFAFNSYTFSVIPKGQLLQLIWLALALLYAGRTVRRPDSRNGLMLALMLSAAFYTTVYYGLFAYLSVALVAIAGVILVGPNRRRIRSLGFFAASGLLSALLSLPLALAYFDLSRRLGLVRTLEDAWPFSASIEMWLTAPRFTFWSWLDPGGELPRIGFYPVESLRPGLILLAIGIVGLLWGSRTGPGRRKWLRLGLLMGALFFFILSLGPELQVNSLSPANDWPLPYSWLHSALPGFSALRAPARFAALVYLCLAGLAALTLSRMKRPWNGVLVAVLFLESLSLPAVTPVEPPEPTAHHFALAALPPAPLLELPVDYPFLWNVEDAHGWLAAQYLSMDHWHPTPAGYSGFVPPRHPEMLRLLNRFPERSSINLIRALGVGRLLLKTERFEATRLTDIDRLVDNEGWILDKGTESWLITLTPKPVSKPDVEIRLPERARAGGRVALPVRLNGDGLSALPPGDEIAYTVQWWQDGNLVVDGSLRDRLPFVVDRWAHSSLYSETPEDAGLYSVTLLDGGGNVVVRGDMLVEERAAPPEIRVAPLRLDGVSLLCEDPPGVRLQMKTVGWFDEPVTLSVRILDGAGQEIGRSEVDVAFAAELPRSELLTLHDYDLPLLPLDVDRAKKVVVSAYRWQQETETTIPRLLLSSEGDSASPIEMTMPAEACARGR